MVMLAATSLGLNVELESIIVDEGFMIGGICHKTVKYSHFYYSESKFEYDDSGTFVPYDKCLEDYFKDSGYKRAENIIWCQKFKQMVPGFAITFEDIKPYTHSNYMAAAILVSVPTWNERSPLHDSDTDDEDRMDEEEKDTDSDDTGKSRKRIKKSDECAR